MFTWIFQYVNNQDSDIFDIFLMDFKEKLTVPLIEPLITLIIEEEDHLKLQNVTLLLQCIINAKQHQNKATKISREALISRISEQLL